MLPPSGLTGNMFDGSFPTWMWVPLWGPNIASAANGKLQMVELSNLQNQKWDGSLQSKCMDGINGMWFLHNDDACFQREKEIRLRVKRVISGLSISTFVQRLGNLHSNKGCHRVISWSKQIWFVHLQYRKKETFYRMNHIRSVFNHFVLSQWWIMWDKLFEIENEIRVEKVSSVITYFTGNVILNDTNFSVTRYI